MVPLKIIHVVGPTGTGKTSFIAKSIYKLSLIELGDYVVFRPHFFFKFCLFFWGIVKAGSCYRGFLFGHISRYDKRFFVKARLTYNIFYKLGIQFWSFRRQSYLVVDEGFAQVPFILEFDAHLIAVFFETFSDLFVEDKIILFAKRRFDISTIYSRGHWRLRFFSAVEFEAYVASVDRVAVDFMHFMIQHFSLNHESQFYSVFGTKRGL